MPVCIDSFLRPAVLPRRLVLRFAHAEHFVEQFFLRTCIHVYRDTQRVRKCVYKNFTERYIKRTKVYA